MSMLAIVMIVLGIMLLFFGSRLVVLGAGVGALLGFVILALLPGEQGVFLWLALPIGLAILFALGSGLAKGFIAIITWALGALAGAAIVLGVLSMFNINPGLVVSLILAVVGAVAGIGLAMAFKDWAVIILAALVGALLMVNGLERLLPFFTGVFASVSGLVLAGVSIAYQGGTFGGKRKPTS
jgi:hypothetical protein